MEFSNRTGQQPVAAAPVARQASGGGKKSKGKLYRIITVFILASVGVLIAALAILFATSGKAEREFLDKNKFQAVFLNGGQVYFGKVRELNNRYLVVDNIYYLRVNEAAQAEGSNQQPQQDISLAKLGCELHGPEDQMVINREQVTFWENLKGDGQVAKAIAEFVKQNPDGQQCTTPENNTQPANKDNN